MISDGAWLIVEDITGESIARSGSPKVSVLMTDRFTFRS
jgi:hypothetical protein